MFNVLCIPPPSRYGSGINPEIPVKFSRKRIKINELQKSINLAVLLGNFKKLLHALFSKPALLLWVSQFSNFLNSFDMEFRNSSSRRPLKYIWGNGSASLYMLCHLESFFKLESFPRLMIFDSNFRLLFHILFYLQVLISLTFF